MSGGKDHSLPIQRLRKHQHACKMAWVSEIYLKRTDLGSYRTSYQGKQRNNKSIPNVGDRGREVLEQIDDNSMVIKMFREYGAQIDDRHDRYERIIKINRDITIESKRIIFLLHSAGTVLDQKRDQIYSEAILRLTQLIEKKFQLIAIELESQDPYLYLRSYSAGLQEFVEALLYYQYLKNGSIESCENLCKQFLFKVSRETDTSGEQVEDICRDVAMVIPLPEFFNGLLDFTGELMRRCINNLGSGNIDDCFKICNYVKNIYIAFLGVNYNNFCKEMGRKVYVLRTSLLKMEYACYTIQVRGSEIPKDMLAVVFNASSNRDADAEEDEGYY